MAKKKGEAKKAPGGKATAGKTAKEPAAVKTRKGKRTKKSIVLEMIATKKGATIEEIAQRIVREGIDDDYDKNCKVVKLWLAKMGHNTTIPAIEKDPRFKAKAKAKAKA